MAKMIWVTDDREDFQHNVEQLRNDGFDENYIQEVVMKVFDLSYADAQIKINTFAPQADD